MLKLTMKAEGKTLEDLSLAIEEALRSITAGNTVGWDSNDTGSYSFDLTGEEEEE